MDEPTKGDLIYIILGEINRDMHNYRAFILDCVENELKRWKKQDLRDFLEPEPS